MRDVFEFLDVEVPVRCVGGHPVDEDVAAAKRAYLEKGWELRATVGPPCFEDTLMGDLTLMLRRRKCLGNVISN